MQTNMFLRLLSSFIATVFVTSCTLTATAIPVKGPLAKSPQPILAKFTYAGSGHGKVELRMPWGETCRGTYATVVGGVSHPGFDQEGTPSAVAIASVSGGIAGVQTGRALLMGDQGTTVEVEYTTSGANPRHGHGSAKDSRGNIYKLIW